MKIICHECDTVVTIDESQYKNGDIAKGFCPRCGALVSGIVETSKIEMSPSQKESVAREGLSDPLEQGKEKEEKKDYENERLKVQEKEIELLKREQELMKRELELEKRNAEINQIESVLKGFNGNPACFLIEERLQPKEEAEKPKTTKSLGNKSLPMDEIRRNANLSYPKQSLKELAKAALKIAEVIEERLPSADVSYMVHPSEFAPEVDPNALPIHFLFKKNGVPKVAVVAVTDSGYRTPRVIATQLACDFHDVAYIRVYADGSYSDWMQPGADSGTIEFCKNWLVEKINDNL